VDDELAKSGISPAGPGNGVGVVIPGIPRRLFTGGLFLAVMAVGVVGARAQEKTAESRKIAAIEQSLARSMTALRSYEWIETVTVTVDGEQKSRKENRCYDGTEGTLQKVAIGDRSEGEHHRSRGIRGPVTRRRAAEMEEYIQQALELVKKYVPPDPRRLQSVKDRGHHDLEVLDSASRLRTDFADDLKAGDMRSVDVDPAADRIVGIAVSSYLGDDPADAVELEVRFKRVPGRHELPGASGADGPEEGSGHRRREHRISKVRVVRMILSSSGRHPASSPG
jgi:hypothetical protein